VCITVGGWKLISEYGTLPTLGVVVMDGPSLCADGRFKIEDDKKVKYEDG
jgi:sorbitol-specific phosphotransferase system component IIC